MAVSGLFMVGYGVFRTAVEFFREPDAHLGIRALGFLTQGMILSIPMIVLGILMLVWAYRRGQMDMTSPTVTSLAKTSPAKNKQRGKSSKGKRR